MEEECSNADQVVKGEHDQAEKKGEREFHS